MLMTRGHDQLTTGQIRGRIRQFDRMRPGDLAVGVPRPGHHDKAEAVDLGQVPHGDRHRSSLTPFRRSPVSPR